MCTHNKRNTLNQVNCFLIQLKGFFYSKYITVLNTQDKKGIMKYKEYMILLQIFDKIYPAVIKNNNVWLCI